MTPANQSIHAINFTPESMKVKEPAISMKNIETQNHEQTFQTVEDPTCASDLSKSNTKNHFESKSNKNSIDYPSFDSLKNASARPRYYKSSVKESKQGSRPISSRKLSFTEESLS